MRCAGCGKPIGEIHQGTPLFRGQPMCDECDSGVNSKGNVSSPANDSVNHPSHYNAGKRETIDVLDDMGVAIPGAIFNIVKYLSRFQHKHATPEGQLEDLRKAQWYMNWLVEKHTPPTKEVKDEQASHS